MKKIIGIIILLNVMNWVFGQTPKISLDSIYKVEPFRWDGLGFSHGKWGTTYIVERNKKGKVNLKFPSNPLTKDSIIFYSYDWKDHKNVLVANKIHYNQILKLYVNDRELKELLKSTPLSKYNKYRSKLNIGKLTNLLFLDIDIKILPVDTLKDFLNLPNLTYLKSFFIAPFANNLSDCAEWQNPVSFPYSYRQVDSSFVYLLNNLPSNKKIYYLNNFNILDIPFDFDLRKVSKLSYLRHSNNWDDLLSFDLTPLYTGIKPNLYTQSNFPVQSSNLKFFQYALLHQKFHFNYSENKKEDFQISAREKSFIIPKIDTLKKHFNCKLDETTQLNIVDGYLDGDINLNQSNGECGTYLMQYGLKSGKITYEFNLGLNEIYHKNPIPNKNKYCYLNKLLPQKPSYGFIRSDSLYYEFTYTPQLEFIFHSVYYYKKATSIVKIEYEEKRIKENNDSKIFYSLSKIHIRDKNNKIFVLTSDNPDFKKYSDLLNTLKIDFICH